mmetsp:Transcript_32255/g.68706  ORF Transcript_32255/g.68706 Transcript_32255/m.68706 type:complete len:206 (+) Transcript_32255:418-1035(+)
MLPPTLDELLPFLASFLWGDPASLMELPLIMGSCSELGGAEEPFLTNSELYWWGLVADLRRLLERRGDMKVMGRPPGVVVSASWRSALRSSSKLMSRSAVCNALETGLEGPSEEDMLKSSLLTGALEVRLSRGVGNRGEANTSLKLMLIGVSGAASMTEFPFFFPGLLEARGLMQIMLRWLSAILGVFTPASPPCSSSAKKWGGW